MILNISNNKTLYESEQEEYFINDIIKEIKNISKVNGIDYVITGQYTDKLYVTIPIPNKYFCNYVNSFIIEVDDYDNLITIMADFENENNGISAYIDFDEDWNYILDIITDLYEAVAINDSITMAKKIVSNYDLNVKRIRV